MMNPEPRSEKELADKIKKLLDELPYNENLVITLFTGIVKEDLGRFNIIDPKGNKMPIDKGMFYFLIFVLLVGGLLFIFIFLFLLNLIFSSL